jgi:hypothetical protein
MRSMGMSTTPAEAVGKINVASKPEATDIAKIPRVTMRRGLASGSKRGTKAAVAKSAIESGKSLSPVAKGLRPITTVRKSGTTKNTPLWTAN